MLALAALALPAVLGLALSGCRGVTVVPDGGATGTGRRAAAKEPTARVTVTRDFGARLMIDQKVPVERGMTVMDALKRVAKIETQYGGGFVSAIDGVRTTYKGKTSVQKDWFYTVNGVLAQVGAADHPLVGGDVIWWDFHDWSFAPVINATISHLSALLTERRPTRGVKVTLLYGRSMKSRATEIGDRLSQVGRQKVDVLQLDGRRPRAGNTLVMGAWDELGKLEWVQQSTLQGKLNGTFVVFRPPAADGASQIDLLTSSGSPGRTLGPDSGLIMAVGTGDGRTTIWLLTGTDAGGAGRAADLLLEQPAKLRRYFGVAVDPTGELIRIPVPQSAGAAP